MRKILLGLGFLCAYLALPTQAFAHHALGGQLPIGFSEGLLSGLAHPIIEVGHLAFILAIGVLTAVSQRGFSLPVWFVGGTLLGCLLNVSSLEIQPAAWMVPFSAFLIGAYLAWGRIDTDARWQNWIFLIAGALHGLAYAQAIIGSENNSLQGYLLGFAIIQTMVAWSAMLAAYWLWRGDRLYENARVCGGVLGGMGLTALYQTSISNMLTLA